MIGEHSVTGGARWRGVSAAVLNATLRHPATGGVNLTPDTAEVN